MGMMSQYVAEAKGNYSNWSGSDASKTLVTKLNALLDVMEADLEKIVNLEIKSNSECVARETAIIKEAAAKTARNSDLKEKAIKMCAKFVEEVKEAQAARRTEVGVVRQILNLMNVRFGKV